MSSERGDLRVNITGNQSGFTSTLNAVKANAKKFAEEINSGFSVASIGSGLLGGLVGAASFEGIKSLISETFSRAKEVKELSEQFDLSTDSIQRWEKALGKAGLESSVFFRALESIRGQREAARNDPSKRDLFDMTGLTGAALNTNVSDEQFLLQALQSGLSRPQLNQLLGGRMGARLGAAVPFLGGSPLLPEGIIDQVSGGQRNIAGVGRFFKGILTRSAAGFSSMFTEQFWGDVGTAMTGGIGELMAKRAARNASKASEVESERLKSSTDAQDEAEYQQLAAQNKQEAEDRLKIFDSEEKLRDAKRKTMRPGAARRDMINELSDLDARIKTYTDVESLLGPSEKLKLAGLMTQRFNLASELTRKPFELSGNDLSSIGLFSSARTSAYTLDSGYGKTTQEEQLDTLRKIEHNTNPTNHPDPFQ